MTNEQIIANIKNRVASQSISGIKMMAQALVVDEQDGADTVYDIVMDELMGRLNEDDFVKFCDDLDKIMDAA